MKSLKVTNSLPTGGFRACLLIALALFLGLSTVASPCRAWPWRAATRTKKFRWVPRPPGERFTSRDCRLAMAVSPYYSAVPVKAVSSSC